MSLIVLSRSSGPNSSSAKISTRRAGFVKSPRAENVLRNACVLASALITCDAATRRPVRDVTSAFSVSAPAYSGSFLTGYWVNRNTTRWFSAYFALPEQNRLAVWTFIPLGELILQPQKSTTTTNTTNHTTMKFLLTLSLLMFGALAQDVQIKNLRLFYGNEEYFIKGMAYSPSPLAKTYEGQNEGSGLCTPRPTYAIGSHTVVQSTSSCNTEDYFDGSIYTPGPSTGFWNAVWERDFPLIQNMGVNTIRIYHAHPITQAAIDNNAAYTDKTVKGTSHTAFLDLASQHNLKVVFPLYAESAALDTVDASFIQEYIRNIIDEVGNHPALLLYTFGNELQFSSRDQAYIDKINSFIDYARSYQNTKWNRKIPFTVALIDIPNWYSTLVNGLHHDIVTTNAGYRGFDFTDLWSSHLYGLSCDTGIPTLIGEMGIHQDTPQFDTPDWFPKMWGDIIAHKTYGAIGGFYFSWVEEHWKGVVKGADWTKQPDVYMGAYVQNVGSGGYAPDNVTPKSGGAYDANSAATGFKSNPFTKDSQQTLANAQANYCDGTFQAAPVKVLPPPPFTPDPTTVTVLPAAAAIYTFDSISNERIWDLTGNGNDMVLYGSPNLSPGLNGSQAINLNGQQTAQLSNLNRLSGRFSASVFLYLSQLVDTETKILSSKKNWDDATGFELTLNSLQKTINFVGSGGSVAQYTNLKNISAGKWFHVGFTHDNGAVNLYVEGVQVAAQSGVTPVQATTNGLFLGSEADKVAFLTGAIENLLFFNDIVGGDHMIEFGKGALPPHLDVITSSTISSTSSTTSTINTDTSTSASTADPVATGNAVSRTSNADASTTSSTRGNGQTTTSSSTVVSPSSEGSADAGGDSATRADTSSASVMTACIFTSAIVAVLL
ncbi:hypothetical protein PROFUN_01122 [Planoprotostelium fungivorum]|uniref:LamG-like jellyroll fold domain-containing protein n=1 Tax=Planoprotostelium fungivorum TaxID=1890364 RepID=A0A2P6NCE7_9EUKA|nr:hypothetical protein PROFUN_01122 [Planoprotostelium fungivorum]